MVSFLRETQTIWERLKKLDIPIVIYGMGDGTVKILDVFEKHDIKICDIFASDNYVRGHSFLGYDILKYSEITKKYDDFLVIMGFAVNTPQILEHIQKINSDHEVLSPDVPVCGGGIFDLEFLNSNESKILQAYEMLEDDTSKKVFENLINFKISGKFSYLIDCETPRSEIYSNIYNFSNCETFVDVGAYNGDTVMEFIKNVDSKYKKIYAIEPDTKNFKRLEKTVELYNISNIECINCGIYSSRGALYFNNKSSRSSSLNYSFDEGDLIKVDTIDNILDKTGCSYIKYDVEGAERDSILGSKHTILNFSPKLEIAAYHRNEDFFELILLLKNINKDYKVFLRHHPYIPAWETNIYACI